MKVSQKHWFLIGKICIIIAMLLLWWRMYDKLPFQVPSHRNANWEVNGYSSRLASILILPCISLFLLILFFFIPQLDPKKARYKEFSTPWEWMQMIILLFFAYFYAIIFYIILHPGISIIPFMSWGIGVLFLVFWITMRHIKSNYFVGIRTPWTLANEEVWNKTHILWGWTFGGAWLLCIVAAFLWVAIFPIFLSAIMIWAIVPVVYSYVIYRNIGK